MAQTNSESYVVAVDGSKNSDLAFQHVLMQSKENDKIHIVTARDLSPAVDFIATGVIDEEKATNNLTSALKLLQSYQQKCEQRNRKCTIERLEFSGGSGALAESICQAALKQHASQIVLGSRGLDPLSRVMLGSVTHHVVTHCPVSTTVIKNPAKDQKS